MVGTDSQERRADPHEPDPEDTVAHDAEGTAPHVQRRSGEGQDGREHQHADHGQAGEERERPDHTAHGEAHRRGR